MGINHSRIIQKFGPNRKLRRSIISSKPALLAQSTTDQHRAISMKAPTTLTCVSMRFAAKQPAKPISSLSQSERHNTSKFVATFWQTRTIATKACKKSKRSRYLPGSHKYLRTKKPDILQVNSHKCWTREIKTMSNTLWGKDVLEYNISSQVVVHL